MGTTKKTKRNKKIATGLLMALMAVILITTVLTLSGVVKFASVETRVLYPLFSSVCCEQFGTQPVPANPPPIKNYGQTYTCPTGTTGCNVRNPQITCEGDAWLGYTIIWLTTIRDVTGTYKFSSNNVPFVITDPNLPSNGFDTGAQAQIDYTGFCVDNVIFLNPTTFPILLANSISPATGQMNIRYYDFRLRADPALGGAYWIDNTNLCIRNAEAYEYAKKLPKAGQESLIDQMKNTLASTFNIHVNAPKPTIGSLVDTTQLLPGQCYLAVDKWTDLPYVGNVNPRGQYQNQDVICSMQTGLVKIEEIETYENVRYVIPTVRLQQPDRFCCEHQTCRQTYGVDWNCVDYTCKQEVGFCNSDIECQPMAGEMMDSNCYRDGNKFFTWYSTCNLNTHMCTPANEREVKCCPSYCAQLGQWCDFNEGCKPTVVKQSCPPNKCCNVYPLSTDELVSPYYTQACYSGLMCCPTRDAYQGDCQQVCGAIPTCSWWDVGCHLGGLLKGFQIPLITEESIIGAIVGAVILGLAGFLLAGPVGSLAGIIIGGILGFVVASILVILHPFVALFAAFLGGVYAYEFLQPKIQNKNYLLIGAIVLGLIAGYVMYMSFWYGAVIMIIYFMLKIALALTPAEKLAMGLQKYLR